MGFHCADCIHGSFVVQKETNLYQGTCGRGFTLANPHATGDVDRHFADKPEHLVPVTDPYGKEYLRTSNVCSGFDKRD